MRVLFLGPYPPPHGGVQTNLVAIRNYLLAQGIPCEVINITRFRSRASSGVYYPRSALGVLWLLLRLRYDIVHLHFGGQLTPRLLGLCVVCCLLPTAKTVLTFHSGGYPSSKEGRSARPFSLRGFVFRMLDGVIGVNQKIVELFCRLGVPANRIRLISAFSFSAPASDNALSQNLREFCQAHRPLLVTVGLLEWEYDLPLQIDVLGPSREKFPNAGLVIIGAGSIEKDLRAHICAKPYSEHVLLCGDVPHAVALRVMSEGDAFLRTTLYDGDSVAVREALHLGVPVIATDNGMRPSGVTLIPPSDLEALRRAIEECIVRTGALRCQPDQDEKNLEAVLKFYREILER